MLTVSLLLILETGQFDIPHKSFCTLVVMHRDYIVNLGPVSYI